MLGGSTPVTMNFNSKPHRWELSIRPRHSSFGACSEQYTGFL